MEIFLNYPKNLNIETMIFGIVKNEKRTLFLISIIISAICVVIFGYYLHTNPFFEKADFSIWFPALPLMIIFFLIIFRVYFGQLFLKERRERRK
ncbi:MAG: hypothetical protein DRO67_05430 [Candidatus Asgardarchaeum californiense]|nr:MAG: hypothetical protein DRO67_05430 [Candidatus Asgardarchaeum californiense]